MLLALTLPTPIAGLLSQPCQGVGFGFQLWASLKKKKAKNWEMTRLREEVTLDQFLLLNKAAAGQLYKKYDLKGIVGLGIGRNWEDPSDWWCSELVAYLLKKIGMTLSGWGRKTNTYTPNMCYKWPQDVVDRSVF